MLCCILTSNFYFLNKSLFVKIECKDYIHFVVEWSEELAYALFQVTIWSCFIWIAVPTLIAFFFQQNSPPWDTDICEKKRKKNGGFEFLDQGNVNSGNGIYVCICFFLFMV